MIYCGWCAGVIRQTEEKDKLPALKECVYERVKERRHQSASVVQEKKIEMKYIFGCVTNNGLRSLVKWSLSSWCVAGLGCVEVMSSLDLTSQTQLTPAQIACSIMHRELQTIRAGVGWIGKTDWRERQTASVYDCAHYVKWTTRLCWKDFKSYTLHKAKQSGGWP